MTYISGLSDFALYLEDYTEENNKRYIKKLEFQVSFLNRIMRLIFIYKATYIT